MVEALLDAGADADAKQTGIGPGMTPLMNAAKNGHEESVELLLERGADVKATLTGGVGYGATTLMWASATSYSPKTQPNHRISCQSSPSSCEKKKIERLRNQRL